VPVRFPEPIRVCLALLGAAAAPPLVILVGSAAMDVPDVAFAIVAFVYALAHAVVLGPPAYFLARRFGRIEWWVALLAGAAAGILPIAVVSFPWSSQDLASFELGSLFMGGFGAVSGLTAWAVWRFLPA